MKPQLFMIMSRFPYPIEKGDKLRAFYHIKCLSESFDIHLCSITTNSIKREWKDQVSKYCSKVHILKLSKWYIAYNLFKTFFSRKLPFQVALFYNPFLAKKIDNIIKESKINHIHCLLIRVSEYVKHHRISKTLDYMDTFSKGMERRHEVRWFRPNLLMKIEANALKRYENYIYKYFDNSVVISEQDKMFIPHINNHKIKIVKNGIDTNFFTINKNKEIKKDIDILFTGNMSYPPNINSAKFIIDSIMPLVWDRYPNVKVYIVGGFPPISIRRRQNDNVVVTGWVDDMRIYYARAKMFVAPMRISTGLQNKIIEAMAMRVPCVISELSNRAIGADENTVLLARQSMDYFNAISKFLEKPDCRDKMAEKALKFVNQNFSWQNNTQTLTDTIIESGKFNS